MNILYQVRFRWLDQPEDGQPHGRWSAVEFDNIEEAIAYQEKLRDDQQRFVTVEPKSVGQLEVEIRRFEFSIVICNDKF